MNKVYLNLMKFSELDINTGTSDSVSYGYTIYDDEDSSFNNIFSSFESLKQILKLESLLSYLIKEHPVIACTIEFSNGLYINDEWVNLSEINKEIYNPPQFDDTKDCDIV